MGQHWKTAWAEKQPDSVGVESEHKIKSPVTQKLERGGSAEGKPGMALHTRQSTDK